ncbi:hypothetical protein ES288_A08G093100v1 [Gossypium darwinii]|uniref:Uncharacterized protein n=2 Tax=Gossypium TaxID=3633 RepID=A0A5D2PC46_GOSTO|nr:hypothetical protein ES288_A08G093100v1 [Gossypium darwinii]TYI13941.1 hypothetical protein ES332_A08G093800v1 [Gossypium tomentosum]
MVRILLNSCPLPARSTFNYLARTSICDSKSSKAYNSHSYRIHIQGARNIATTHWDRAARIQNQATHKSYIWSLDYHCNQ